MAKCARDYILGGYAAGELFQPDRLERWVEKALSGKIRSGALLWRILVLSLWWEQMKQYQTRNGNSELYLRGSLPEYLF